MAASDAFDGLVRRLGWFILAIGAIGAAVVAIRWGLRPAGAFGFGAAAAYWNMRWLAGTLRDPGGAATGLLLLRFGLIGGAAYAILELFGISPLYLLAGLLSASLAVVLEILFQLFYART